MTASQAQPAHVDAPGPSGASTYRKPQFHVLLMQQDVVARLRNRATQPVSPAEEAAAEQIVRKAEAALDTAPSSVTDKPGPPITGDPNDYASLSIYYNPNPHTPDGLPYVQIDGHVNPEIEDYDAPRLIRLSNALHTLSVGYLVTGREDFAAKAAALLRHWFLAPKTRMNPHMRYAQFIPGTEGVRGPGGYPPRRLKTVNGGSIWVSYGGLIEGMILPGILESIERLRGSASLIDEELAQLATWFEAFLAWVLTSPLGEDERKARNNHGTWYCVQVAAYALASSRFDLARKILTVDVPKRLDMQLAADGSQPEELVRANALGYSCFTLAAFCNLAIYGQRLDVDLWHHKTARGRSLKSGIDWLIRHLETHPHALENAGNPKPLPVAWSVLSAAATQYGWAERIRSLKLGQHLPAAHPYRLLHPLR